MADEEDVLYVPDFDVGSSIELRTDEQESGMAIIYAPVLVMRPERPTANSTPSKLLQQLGLPTTGASIGAGETVAAPAKAE